MVVHGVDPGSRIFDEARRHLEMGTVSPGLGDLVRLDSGSVEHVPLMPLLSVAAATVRIGPARYAPRRRTAVIVLLATRPRSGVKVRVRGIGIETRSASAALPAGVGLMMSVALPGCRTTMPLLRTSDLDSGE